MYQVVAAAQIPPAQHGVPEEHTWPHDPQLLVSVCSYTQALEQTLLLGWVPQVPTMPGSAHELHGLPVHAVLQQKPLAQKPLVHWSVAVHVVPVAALGTQRPPEQ